MYMISLQVHTANSALRSSKPVEWDFIPFVGMEIEIEKTWEEKTDHGIFFTVTNKDGKIVETVTVRRIIYKSLEKFFHVEATTFHGKKDYEKIRHL